MIISGNTSATRGGGIGSNGTVIMGSHDKTTSLSIAKKWAVSSGLQMPESVGIEIYRKTAGSDAAPALVGYQNLNQNSGWKVSISNLPASGPDGNYEYSVKEAAVDGFTREEKDGEVIFTAQDGSGNMLRSDVTGGDGAYTVSNRQITELTVKKIWTDADDLDGLRPQQLAVQLYADGQPLGDPVMLTADGGWTYTWKELDAADQKGNKIAYTARETEPEGYTNSGNSVTAARTTVSSQLQEDGTVKVVCSKDWPEGALTPENISIQLLADGAPVEGQTGELNEDNSWTAQFTGLPAQGDGSQIVYSIKETGAGGYSADDIDLSGDETVTVGDFKIEKMPNPWQPQTTYTISAGGEGSSDLQSITFQIYQDGKPGISVTLNEENGWTGKFWNIPDVSYDSSWNEIPVKNTLRVTEVNGYPVGGSTAAGGQLLVFENRHTPQTPAQIPVRIKLQKRGSDTGKGLQGAVYGLYEKDADGSLTLQEQQSSDAEGFMYFDNIKANTVYLFKEITAPTGYKLDENPGTPFRFTVSADGTISVCDEQGTVPSQTVTLTKDGDSGWLADADYVEDDKIEKETEKETETKKETEETNPSVPGNKPGKPGKTGRTVSGKKAKVSKASAVKTGDTSHIGITAAVCAASGLTALVLLRRRKKADR